MAEKKEEKLRKKRRTSYKREEEIVKLEAGTTVAIRCEKEDNEEFFVARLLEDYYSGAKTLKVAWMEKLDDPENRLIYEITKDTDKIPPGSIVGALPTLPFDPSNDGYIIPEEIRKEINDKKDLSDSDTEIKIIGKSETVPVIKIEKEISISSRKRKRKNPEESDEEWSKALDESLSTPDQKKRKVDSDGTPKTPRTRRARSPKRDTEGTPRTPKRGTKRGASPKKSPRRRKGVVYGEPNPDIPFTEEDAEFSSTDPEISHSCCAFCTNRDLYRLIKLGSIDGIKNASKEDSNDIRSIYTNRSHQSPYNCLDIALKLQRHDILQYLQSIKSKNLNFPTIRYKYEDTGSSSYRSIRLRKVALSRGGKEGNNAFRHDLIRKSYYECEFNDVFKDMARFISVDQAKLFDFAKDSDTLREIFDDIARSGNFEVVRFILQKIPDRDEVGINNLHVEVLNTFGTIHFKFF